jgi:glutaredoxin
MKTVKVYTKEGCQFSASLKALLEAREIPYDETVLTHDSAEYEELVTRTGSKRLPQAFIGYIPLGSTQEVQAADANGMLATLVQDDDY